MDENFLNNYQKTLFGGNNETAVAEAGIQRKCLAQMYSQSLATLDEQSICGLLEKNLHKYCEMLEKDVSVKTSPDENTIHYPVDLRSNLSQIDLGSLLKPFPCYESKDIASDFTNFRDCMFKSKTQVPIKQHREQKLTRSTSEDPPRTPFFKTARNELLVTQNHKKIGTNPQQRRTLGLRSNVNKPFVSPVLTNQDQKTEDIEMEVTDERLKNIDQKMIDLIKSEIMNIRLKIEWDDIAGLDFAKRAIREAVVLPMLRPDLFTGLRRPPKGILLFGPPGTGKTLIGKCVASQSKSTFFSISASSLTSKWVGEGEKMVRALFAVARCHQPAVIFIDEVDSLLSQRSETEHESSRRMKTEFLVQLEGATTDGEERLLVIGATNRPQELDEAARRRFVKRLYVPLPEFEARLQLLTRLIENERHNLDDDDFRKIAQLSDGYSGSDIRNLCAEASLGPIRSIDMSLIEKVQANEVRPLIMDDFHTAFTRIRSSVAPKDLEQYVIWDKTYGSGL